MASTIKLQPSGHEVECPDGDTVLAALERAGYTMPNNCRAGACGECRCKVTEGTFDQGMVLDMALSQEDREAGYGLMCMAKPTSDTLGIQFGTDDALPKLFPPREHVPFVVTDLLPRTPRMLEVRLRPLGENLRFWPGQYIMLGDESAGAPLRSYSLANAPRPDGELQLIISRIDDGRTSRWVHDTLAVGDQVSVNGPYGTFVGDPKESPPVLCLTAGSGLAPILSLTDAALRRRYPNDVTIVYSARSEADVFDRGMMRWWERRNRRFTFVVTYTGDAPEGARWTGRIPEVLPRMFGDLSTHSVYIAGSPEFVDACRTGAAALGAAPERTYVEGYFNQAPAEIPPLERLG